MLFAVRKHAGPPDRLALDARSESSDFLECPVTRTPLSCSPDCRRTVLHRLLCAAITDKAIPKPCEDQQTHVSFKVPVGLESFLLSEKYADFVSNMTLRSLSGSGRAVHGAYGYA